MRYAVIVLLYNPQVDTLSRLKLYSENFDCLYAIDDSEVLSPEIVKNIQALDNCIYHKMDGNQGLSKALEYGFNQVSNYDYVLTMDQDSVYDENNINKMKDFIENFNDDSVAIFSANYSKMYHSSAGKIVESKLQIPINSYKYVNFCMTSTSFIKVKYLNDIIPMKNFFIGYVDNYLCYRFLEEGKRLVRVGCSQFSQQVGNNVSNSFYNRFFNVIYHSPVRYYYMVRNNLLIQSEFKNNKVFRTELRISLFRVIFNIFIGEKKKISKLKAAFLGYRDYLNRSYGKIPSEKLLKIT